MCGESKGRLRKESGQAPTYGDDRGQRPTAGWANNGRSRRFMVQPLPPAVLLVTVQKRPPEGAVGRCPAAQAP
jgi:hypothetical protein